MKEHKSHILARLISVLCCAALLLGLCAAAYADGDRGEIRIRVFETSDIHGYLMDTSSGDEAAFQYRLAYIAQAVNEARASDEYDDVLLVDGGDIYQGMPASNLTTGAAVRAALDAMDYDAVALGNHEFDWGVTAYCADPDATVPAYELGGFSGDPDIPILASNLYYADSDERVDFTRDYVIVEKAGVRIALIGYIPDYTMSIMADKIAPYDIDGDLDALSARVKEINDSELPDVTVVMAHAMPVDVADALSPEDVDLVTGGHKHDGIYGVADSGVPYIQADCYAQGYATAIIVISGDGTVKIEEPLYTSITEEKEALYDTPENAEHLDDTILAISHAAWDEISDQMSGLTYEYLNHGTEEEPDIEIVSITLDDGTDVDVHDEETLYRVVTSNYSATLEGGVFIGKEPLVPEAEAPIDNLTIIDLLREEARDNEGYIAVDTRPRCFCLNEEAAA